MTGLECSRNHRLRPSLAVLFAVVLFTGLSVGVLSTGVSSPTKSAGPVTADATLSVTLSYSPNPVNVNAQTQGSYSISGGSGTYTIWVNQTPPGCAPQTNPFTTSMASGTFTCTPTSTGPFNVMVTVHDSAGDQGSTTTLLTVNNGGGNGTGTGSGNGSSSGFSLPAGLVSTLVLFGAIFIGAIVAMAAGVIATALLVSRGLRRLNETMKKTEEPPSSGKPPS